MRGALHRYLERAIRSGSLIVVDPDGTSHSFGDGSGTPIRARFTSRQAMRNVVRHPTLKLGEELVDGGMRVEEGSIYDLLVLLMVNARGVPPPWPAIATAMLRRLTRRFRQFNSPGRARRNVHAHYDLDRRLYALFLDDDLQYSCAYFENGVTSLEEAQLAKKRHLASKLALARGQRVLDIGCGWGGLGIYLAERCGADVTGITLSEEQVAVSNQRAKEHGIADRVRFVLQDYREVEGPFDRIVSVGMFEHVGVSHYRAFFNACRELLAPNGVMLLHTIGRANGPGDTGAWVQRYIFPGGYAPALSEVLPHIERARLRLTDVEVLRLHYARTLRAWRERFLAHREEVAAMYDERFCRIWEFYLAGAEAEFRTGAVVNLQLQMAKSHEALPLTRDYMRDAEQVLRHTEGRSADDRPSVWADAARTKSPHS